MRLFSYLFEVKESELLIRLEEIDRENAQKPMVANNPFVKLDDLQAADQACVLAYFSKVVANTIGAKEDAEHILGIKTSGTYQQFTAASKEFLPQLIPSLRKICPSASLDDLTYLGLIAWGNGIIKKDDQEGVMDLLSSSVMQH